MTERDDPTSGWEGCAAAWGERSSQFERAVQGVTLALIDRAGLFPGESVLELACGPGGMLPLIADSVSPGGRVFASDIAPAMIEIAEVALERNRVRGVELAVGDIGWIDRESGSVGAIVSRFGYMFADDPEAALKEARRVLRPGGRLATAVWDVPERNPYGAVPLEALAAVGLDDGPRAGDPGMFRLSEDGRIEELLLAAGFTEVVVEPADVSFGFDSLDSLVDWTLGLSQRVAQGLAIGAEGSLDEFTRELSERSARWTSEDGSIVLPGVALIASGRA